MSEIPRDRAVRILRAKTAELEAAVRDGLPYDGLLRADVALIATILSDHLDTPTTEAADVIAETLGPLFGARSEAERVEREDDAAAILGALRAAGLVVVRRDA